MEMRTNQRCACGLPLHYSDPAIQAQVQALVDELGEWVPVHLGNDKYLAQRHYIALHGLKGQDIEDLCRQGIVRKG